MDRVEQLKELIALYWSLDPRGVDGTVEFSGQRLSRYSSLRMLRFLASVEERFQVQIEEPDAIKTVSDLLRLVAP